MEIRQTKYFDNIQRKIVAVATGNSWNDTPHAGHIYKAKVGKTLDLLKEINSERTPDRKITVNTLALKIITEGIKACPVLNAHIDFNKNFVTGNITYYNNIDISMPMIFPDGRMMTVNLHDFHNKNLDDMIDYLADVKRKMKNTNIDQVFYDASIDNTKKELKKGHILSMLERVCGIFVGHSQTRPIPAKERAEYNKIPESERLTKHDIEQGTVTISNLGSVYREGRGYTTLIDLIAPQIAAFGIDSIREEPVIEKDENGKSIIAIKKIMPIVMAFDHRALDFDMCVPFFRRLDQIFEHPEEIKEWINK